MTPEIQDVAPGLWIWRLDHPDWAPHVSWSPPITSTVVESRGEVGVLDALAPPDEATEIWERRDARPPTFATPEQRAIVFADALTERDGELLVWGTPWHSKRVLPALRELLDLPLEHVIISHGEPVHDRAAFERALELPPYMGEMEAQA